MVPIKGICLICVVAILLCGCAKCIEINHAVVDVEIVDTDYHPAWTQFIYSPASHTMRPIHHPAHWNTELEAQGKTFNVPRKDMYEVCHGREGEKTRGVLETKYYDNGRYSANIILVE